MNFLRTIRNTYRRCLRRLVGSRTETPSSEAVRYAKYILNHYARDSHADALCLARDLERHGWCAKRSNRLGSGTNPLNHMKALPKEWAESKLTKLSNGSWVDMTTVTAIRTLPTEAGSTGTLHRARVIVHHGAQCIEVLTANDDDHAATMADEVAGIVNQTDKKANDKD